MKEKPKWAWVLLWWAIFNKSLPSQALSQALFEEINACVQEIIIWFLKLRNQNIRNRGGWNEGGGELLKTQQAREIGENPGQRLLEREDGSSWAHFKWFRCFVKEELAQVKRVHLLSLIWFFIPDAKSFLGFRVGRNMGCNREYYVFLICGRDYHPTVYMLIFP